MATETITLKPNESANVSITGNLALDLEPDWGEQSITTSLATGPDVRGGVPGVPTQNVREIALTIQVSADTDAAYLTAANSLNTAASFLGLKRGTITRQIVFPDGTSSEELEIEVLECSLDADEGWLQAHRRFSRATLNLVCQPFWLATEELITTVLASTDSATELPVDVAVRGNVPAPARLVLTDQASTARRFVEIGGAFSQDIGSTSYEFPAVDFSLTGADGVLGAAASDTAAIGGRSISVDDLVPIWRVVGYLNDLPFQGSFRARLRALGGTDDATALMRVSWQAGDAGAWQEIGTVSLSTSYFDIDVGTIANYGEADTINVKVECSATDTDTSGSQKLDTLTLFPAEVYAVARGVPITGATSGVAVFDDFIHTEASTPFALAGLVAPIAPATFGTWTEAGDATPDWTISIWGSDPNVKREISTADADVNTGQFVVVGNPAMTDTTVSVDEVAVINTSTTKNDETRGGIVARYVDTNNWLMLVLRDKKQASGRLKEVALYKRVAGTVTKLDAEDAGGFLSLSVTTAGAITWTAEETEGPNTGLPVTRVLAADADLAGGGALNDGKVGIYAAANHNKGAVTIKTFAATANAPVTTYVDVVRDGGGGEISSEGAWSTAADGTDPQPVSVVQGSRLWVPPLTGRFMVKVRSSDSEVEADTGYALSTDLNLYARPAFSTLSDSTA